MSPATAPISTSAASPSFSTIAAASSRARNCATASTRRAGSRASSGAGLRHRRGILLPALGREREHAVPQMVGIDAGGVACQLIVAAAFDEPAQRVLALAASRLAPVPRRVAADRVLHRPLDDRAPQLTFREAAEELNHRGTSSRTGAARRRRTGSNVARESGFAPL